MQALTISSTTKTPRWSPRGRTPITRLIGPPKPTVRFRALPPPATAISAVASPPKELKFQKTHSMPPEKVELFKSLENWASEWILPLLKPVDQCWQPSTFLPDPSLPSDEFTDQVRALRDGSGRDPGTENNPYLGFVYTSFQERATFVSHGNTARLAKEGGDPVLARICGTIAADEKRHENAYAKIVEKLLEVDPNGAMIAIADMMRKKITMPAHLMYDGRDPKLFEHFAAVAQRRGIYTADDYADILEFLIGRWRLEKLEGLSGEAKGAQEFVCGLAPRIRKLQERADERAKKMEPHGVKFSWIFNKEIVL
ncbi:hypothetical protein UlMin_036644 [Ulmus minor]